MKKLENMTEQEIREDKKRIRKKRIMEVINFIIGFLEMSMLMYSSAALGKSIFNTYYTGFIGFLIFVGFTYWRIKMNENEENEKSDRRYEIRRKENQKIEEEKQAVLEQQDDMAEQIEEMYKNGEISLESALKLVDSLREMKQKTEYINHLDITIY